MDGVIVQKFLSHVGFAAAALLPLIGNADIKALGDDGRKIMLKDNGSWAYISNDRLATSEDGRRVLIKACLLYTSPSPRDRQKSRMPSSA